MDALFTTAMVLREVESAGSPHRAAYEAHVVLAERAHDRARVRRRQPWIAVAFEPHARAASRSPKFTSIAAVAPQM